MKVSPRPVRPSEVWTRSHSRLPNSARRIVSSEAIFIGASRRTHSLPLVGEGEGGGSNHAFPAVGPESPKRKARRDPPPRPAPTRGAGALRRRRDVPSAFIANLIAEPAYRARMAERQDSAGGDGRGGGGRSLRHCELS